MSGAPRPWLLRLLPARAREWLVYARYLPQAGDHAEWFRDAPLMMAPGVHMDLAPTDVGHAVIAFAGVFEAQLSRRIARLARRGGLLVDVGANYGYYSLLWAAARPANRVLALEASPRNIDPLRANIRKNGFAARIDARELAAGRTTGTITLDLGPADQTGWAGIAAAGATHVAAVPVTRLDDLAACESMDRIDVLKVDVEGADAWVLEGAERLLTERRIGHVFFERNDERMAALGIRFEDTVRFLAGLGYRASRLATTEWQALPVG